MMPPMGAANPALWMAVEDIFHITGRGTVLTGQLQGDGQLSVGDALVCDGQRWQVSGIEQFRKMLNSALPGSSIGVMIREGLPAGMLRGQIVQFETAASAGQYSQDPQSGLGPQFGQGPQFGPFMTVTPKKKRRFR